MAVQNLSRPEMDRVIHTLNNNFNTRASVINEGQLGFALGKPSMSLYGREMHPELHQKAAVLMEALCKSHTSTWKCAVSGSRGRRAGARPAQV